MQSIPEDANFFAKLDAVHGYFQLALDEGSSFLTTFLIPSRRYRYLRAPMGCPQALMNGVVIQTLSSKAANSQRKLRTIF